MPLDAAINLAQKVAGKTKSGQKRSNSLRRPSILHCTWHVAILESRPTKIHTKATGDGGTLSDPKMSGLKQKKAADGVNKKQRKSSKSSAAAAVSKDEGGTTSDNNAGSASTAERFQPDHSSAANPASSVSAAPVPSVRRGKCIRIFDDRQKFNWMFLALFHSNTMHDNIFIMCHLRSHFITHLQRAANESGGSTIPTHGRRPPPPSGPTCCVWECPTPTSSNSFWPRGSIRVCCTIPTRVSIRPSSWFSATSSPRWTAGILSGVWPWRRVTIRGRTGAFFIGMNWGNIILPCRYAYFLLSLVFSPKYHAFNSNWIYMRSVSLESGARYGLRHLHANFNRVKFIAQMKKSWGKVKFRQIILDCKYRRICVCL